MAYSTGTPEDCSRYGAHATRPVAISSGPKRLSGRRRSQYSPTRTGPEDDVGLLRREPARVREQVGARGHPHGQRGERDGDEADGRLLLAEPPRRGAVAAPHAQGTPSSGKRVHSDLGFLGHSASQRFDLGRATLTRAGRKSRTHHHPPDRVMRGRRAAVMVQAG